MNLHSKQTTKTLILLIFIGLILLTSCNQQTSNEQESLLTIDLSSPVASIILPLTDIADNIQMSRLETRDDCLVSNFRGFVGKKYIISFEREKILQFSADGAFIREIMHEGKGPNEYSYIGAWDVDKAERFLIIYDNNKDFIYRYDLENGKFADPVHNIIPCYGNALQFLNDSLIAFHPSVYSDSKHHYLIYSLNGNVSKGPEREEFDNSEFHFPISGILSNFRKTKFNSIVYSPSTSDTIYQINETGMSPLLVAIIERNKQSGQIKEGELTEYIHLSKDQLLLCKHSYKQEVNAANNSLMVNINRGNFYVIDFKNRDVLEAKGITAKYLGIELPSWGINSSGDERFYFSISAIDLIESIDRNLEDEHLSPENLESITQLRKSINENDNSIIFSGTFKENFNLSHLR